MNEDHSLPEPESKTLRQESLAKQSISNTLEEPDEKAPVAAADPAHQSNYRQHLGHWAIFWTLSWTGTTLAGGLFGGALGVFALSTDAIAPFSGLLFGLAWAGGTGLFVFLHVGVICWTFWWLNRPIVVVTVAGLVVGFICGVFIFSLITGPMGAFGAYLVGKQFLKSETGKKFENRIKLAKEESVGRLRFTTTDLLLRMTAISVMIAGWTAWIKAQ